MLTQPRGVDMALRTLRAMAGGGIHDQVGGGFHRYAVDATWTVPHFEKMLYDNALLARAYLHGFQLSGDPLLRRACEQTLDWALREMRAPEGGFYSALDADSEGGEGSFYVWTVPELREVLGDDAAAAIAWFRKPPRRATSVARADEEQALNVLEGRGPEPPAAQRERIRAALLAARERRPRPALDDKRLTSWNALMIAALADAGAVLGAADGEDGGGGEGSGVEGGVGGGGEGGETGGATARRYLEAATACAEFLLRDLRGEGGRLLRTYSQGRATLEGYLEDQAFLLEALLVLYEATFQERWFTAARALAEELIERFADPERGGFFSTAADHEALIARRKEIEDGPIPAGNSAAALGLLRLAALSGEQEYERQALGVLRLVNQLAVRHPSSFGHLLQALDFYVSPTREVAIVGPGGSERSALERVVRARPRPRLVLAGAEGAEHGTSVPLLAGRVAIDGRATAYVCERFACQRPVTALAELAAALDA